MSSPDESTAARTAGAPPQDTQRLGALQDRRRYPISFATRSVRSISFSLR